jgi:flagella basal body P-ring formation protein FlgA
MRHGVFFSCWLAFASCSALAEPYSNSEDLRSQISAFLHDQLHNESQSTEEDREISVSNLDPRLKLHQCDTQVQHTIVSPRPYGTNISVKAHCGGGKPWTIYVTARIDTYAPIAVMARNLERGSVLTETDITLSRMNVGLAGFGHVRELDEILGKELKRNLRSGEAVRLSHLKSPQVVRKGDRVVLEAQGSGVSVVTSGRALANGQVGDQIQVENEKSQRVVDAEIVAPGRVRVAL